MFCLHLGWWQNQAVLWGEKQVHEQQLNELRLPKTRGRQPRNPPPKKHPYGVEELASLLLTLPRPLKGNRTEKALAYLPTANGFPLASDPLIAHTESEGIIAPWEVAITPLSHADMLKLIRQCKDRLFAPGILGGYEFAYLNDLAHFALSLLARERFLPTLTFHQGYLAEWEAVLLGSDQARYGEFIKTLPDVCRSVLSRKQGIKPSAPEEVVKEWLNQMITSFIKGLEEGEEHSPSNPHDAWTVALKEARPLKLETGVGGELMEAVKEWKRPLETLLSAPFRLCFRLEEPEDEDLGEWHFQNEGWQVSYLLQDQSDPSLLVKVEEFWNPKGAKRKVLERENLNPRQFTLALLGMASSLSPQIEKSLEGEIPKGFPLDMEGAYQFLTEQAPKLRDAGYGVILPSWWENRTAKVKTRAVVSSPMGYARKRSLWDEVSVDWKVALGGIALNWEELQALADLKAPLVKVRGKWIEASPLEIQKAIAFWKKQTEEKTTLADLMKLSYGSFEGQEIEASGWVKTFFDDLQNPAALAPLPAPQGFKGTLRPYQAKGLSWLAFLRRWGLGGCLADDMGLGKTPQTLASLMHDREEGVTKPSLLICPTSLIANWEKEAKRFTPDLPVMIHHGSNRLHGKAFEKEVKKGPLVVSSYALLLRDLSDFQEIDWDGVILDEAQYIKNPAAKQSKSAFSLSSRYRLALSGTPVENHIGDLWSMMHFANPHFLGSQASFKKTFFAPIQFQRDREAIKRLKQLTAPFVLRRTKTDCSIIKDLPEKNEIKTYTSLTKEQASLYTSVIQDAETTLETVSGIDRKGVILATLMKLKQICNHPAQFAKEGTFRLAKRSDKLERLSQMLAEIRENKERSLIFTQYTSMGEILKTHLESIFGEEALFLHGQLSKKKRDHMVERFQKGASNLFILSLKAGGVGLNLTQANNVFHFDRWWNPAIENQATDRAFRIGQRKRVSVYKFITSGTVEERIDEMIDQKKTLSNAVITEGENYLTELSTDELKEIWKLRSAYCED